MSYYRRRRLPTIKDLELAGIDADRVLNAYIDHVLACERPKHRVRSLIAAAEARRKEFSMPSRNSSATQPITREQQMNTLFDACAWAINSYTTGATENKEGEPTYFDFAQCCQDNGQDPEEVVAVCERAVDENRETSVHLINTPAEARQAMWAVAVLVGTVHA